jgi:hypothetical protein
MRLLIHINKRLKKKVINIKVTSEERRKLEHYFQIIMNDSLPLSQRRVAQILFDELYYSLSLREGD